MESSSRTDTSNEPEVGILLDLGSPIHTVNLDANSDDAKLASKLAGKLATDLGDETSKDQQETLKSATNGFSQDTGTSEKSPLWADVADEHLIDSEQFDFDLPVSPVERSAKLKVDDDDEVFFGPVGLTEACIAKKTQLKGHSSPAQYKLLSPLNVEQYVELFLEANKVAMELTSRKESDESHGSKQDHESKEAGGVGDKSERPSETKPSVKVSDCRTAGKDSPTKLPAKAEARNFKRLIRKDIRSPRRGTYTISVSPANTPPPPHLPSADVCVSKLARDKPQALSFTAVAASHKQPMLKPPGQSKLPVKGITRRSKLPMKAGLKKMIPSPDLSSGMSTDKLLRRKLSSPPKRKRLNSCESEDLASEASSFASETSETSGLSVGMPKGKRPQPGSFHAKGTSGLRPPTKAGTSSSAESDKHKSIATCNKAPTAKPSLLQQGPLQRRMVQANRPLKLLKPGQLTSNKPKPIKAVAGVAKVPSANEATKVTPKKAASIRQTPSRLPSTPSTPVHQDKKAVPKRLLTSEKSATNPAGRSLSASIVPTPQSKLVPPSTPSRSNSKMVPASAGSVRRRSAIPTPSRRSVASSSRLSSTGSTVSNPSPMKFRGQRTSTTTSSPSGSPFRCKLSLSTAKKGAIKLDLDSSPVHTKEATPRRGRPALDTKTNKVGEKKSFPVVGLLIDVNTETSEEKLQNSALSQGSKARTNKENLIDLL